jgi:hypothetical protein
VPVPRCSTMYVIRDFVFPAVVSVLSFAFLILVS